jgi:hypothetical protein
MPRYSDRYLDGLFESSTYHDLVVLQGILTTPPHFDSHQPDYGLPSHFFVVVEGVAWFAQACRSGVWTYFEATPPQRQQAMYEALLQFGPEEFAHHYQFGMRHWRDAQEVAPLDSWMKAMDEVANEWMRTILRAHRAEYKALYAL